jgi:hypothetical protein
VNSYWREPIPNGDVLFSKSYSEMDGLRGSGQRPGKVRGRPPFAKNAKDGAPALYWPVQEWATRPSVFRKAVGAFIAGAVPVRRFSVSYWKAQSPITES